MGIRIVIADDHGVLREGLRSLISKEMGMEVVVNQPHDREPLVCRLPALC